MNEQNGCIREYYNCDEGIDCPCSKYETNKFYSFNINDEILVKLTPIGKDLLKKEHDELFKMYTAEKKKDLEKLSAAKKEILSFQSQINKLI